MTDNDIIKALECCSSEFECHNGCPYYNNGEFKCRDLSFYKDTLDLINRQKAEIEEKSNKLRDVLPIVAELKAEAITEFAERLREKCKAKDEEAWYVYHSITCEDIDQIAKEMKGEQ